MPLRGRKLYDLVFDGRAVTWTARSDCPAVHGRLSDVLGDDLLSLVTEKGDPTWQLRGMSRAFTDTPPAGPEVRPRVIELFDFALLALEVRNVHGSAVDARRSPGLEASHGE